MSILNIHHGLNLPCNNSKPILMNGSYIYYHYLCDGYNDIGWGCGYRTLQTICSWILLQKESNLKVPSLLELQQCLVNIGDKPAEFVGSHQWIGSMEIAYCIETLYSVQSRIFHIKSLLDLEQNIDSLSNHIKIYGSPIMMGGDTDASSKAILGILRGPKDYFLILDPHNVDVEATKHQLQSEGWIQWRSLDSFDDNSFYNFCCPLLKEKEL